MWAFFMNKIRNLIVRINHVLGIFVQGVLVLLFTALITIMSLNVICRYVFKSPLFWAVEASCYILVYLIFWGSALALYRGKHIRIDTKSMKIFPNTWGVLERAGALLEYVFIILMVIGGTILSWKNRASYAGSLPIPTGYVYSAAPTSGVIMFLFRTELLIQPRKDM